MSIVFDTPEGVAFFALASRRSALKFEVDTGRPMVRGQSALPVCKKAYGLKGTKVQVLAQLDALIEKAHEDKASETLAAAGYGTAYIAAARTAGWDKASAHLAALKADEEVETMLTHPANWLTEAQADELFGKD